MEKLAKGKLKKENLDEIAGFGYNPAKLFDSKHPQYQEGKMTSYDPFRQVTVSLLLILVAHNRLVQKA